MANNVWLGTSSSVFATGANWLTGSAPTTGDNVVIDGRAAANLDGSDQSAITLASLRIYKSCTKNIGSYDTPLKIGATICEINLAAEGGNTSSGPATVALDFATIQTTCTVYGGRGSGERGFSAVLLRGTNASNTLNIRGGSVGVGTMVPSEATTFTKIDQSGTDSNLTVGYGVTLATFNQKLGSATISCAITTVNQEGGTLETRGTGAITTANIGGKFISNSTGTITTLEVEGQGFADFSQSAATRTITNATIYGPGGKINAANNALIPGTGSTATPSIIFTNGVKCREGAPTDRVNFGTNLKVTADTL